jgi:plasmid stabilization system protein ParE
MTPQPEGYRLSRLAVGDLEDIYDYTRQRWSDAQAQKYHGELMSAFEAIVGGHGRDATLRLG